MELIACAGKSSEPHALEAVVSFEVCKAHLDTLALVRDLRKRFFPSVGAPDRAHPGMSRGICRAGMFVEVQLEGFDVLIVDPISSKLIVPRDEMPNMVPNFWAALATALSPS
jgi:hypothetical protein